MIGMGENGKRATTPAVLCASSFESSRTMKRRDAVQVCQMRRRITKKVAVIEQAVDRYWKATENFEIRKVHFKIDAAVESDVSSKRLRDCSYGRNKAWAVKSLVCRIVLDGYIAGSALCAF